MKPVSKLRRWARKGVAVFLWFVLGLMLFRGFASMVKGNKTPAAVAQAAPVVQTQTDDMGAGNFAALFAREYFTLDVTQTEGYSKRLAPFLASNVDRNAGLSPSTAKRSTTVQGAWPVQIQRTEASRYLVTVVVAVTTIPGPAPVIQAVPADPKAKAPAPTTPAAAPEQPDTSYMALAVPVATAVDSHGLHQYVVWDLPRVVAMPQQAKVDPLTFSGEDVRDDKAEQLLAAFFKAYANGDNPEAVAYVFEDRKPVPSLGGRLTFQRLASYRMLKRPSGEYLTFAEVELQDRLTQTVIHTRYSLALVQNAGTWYIRAFEPDLGN